jgi:hypothetical protein
MIPEVGAVLVAAKAVVDSMAGFTPRAEAMVALTEAVEALAIRETRAAGGPTYEEQDRTWGEVVVQDEILSDKTGKWYEVTGSGLTKEGKMKVSIKGSTKPILRDPVDPVRVKRGVMGDAADLFQLLWSGTTIRGAAVAAHMAETTEPGDLPEVASIPEEEESDERE